MSKDLQHAKEQKPRNQKRSIKNILVEIQSMTTSQTIDLTKWNEGNKFIVKIRTSKPLETREELKSKGFLMMNLISRMPFHVHCIASFEELEKLRIACPDLRMDILPIFELTNVQMYVTPLELHISYTKSKCVLHNPELILEMEPLVDLPDYFVGVAHFSSLSHMREWVSSPRSENLRMTIICQFIKSLTE